jgi:cytochrome c5
VIILRPARHLSPLLAAGLLSLAAPVASAMDERQAQLFAHNCVQCHAQPDVSAPMMGREEDWQPRRAQGEELLLRHVVEGIRGMPPLGYCAACTEEDLRVMTRMLAGLP